MNFFRTRQRDGVLEHGAFDYHISGETRDAIEDAGERVTLGIRPEHIELADGDERNIIETNVAVVEPMGETTYAYLEIGDQTYTASVDGDLRIEAGDQIRVVFPEHKIHLFDEATGRAVTNSESTGKRGRPGQAQP
jgi:multiple sugar transport system ATP-binding protein